MKTSGIFSYLHKFNRFVLFYLRMVIWIGNKYLDPSDFVLCISASVVSHGPTACIIRKPLRVKCIVNKHWSRTFYRTVIHLTFSQLIWCQSWKFSNLNMVKIYKLPKTDKVVEFHSYKEHEICSFWQEIYDWISPV